MANSQVRSSRGKDENKERGNWTNQLDFLLSCIGFAVGLGNVWRFPYLCYKNGGGAFLIPYVIMLFLCGLPLFFFEVALGQYASSGCTRVWRVSPFIRGLGFAMVIVSALVSIYYNMIIAYVLFYFFASMTSPLPWSTCDNWWNTPSCVPTANGTNGSSLVYPAEEYWENYVLRMTDGLEDGLGKMRWQLVLCLMLAWFTVYLCLIKGIKSSGKVVYFTALFPYVVLTILLVRGATLPGAKKGIEFYMVPEWERLKDAKVWGDAAVQIFYSLGPAWGGLLTFASYNRFRNNCERDAIIISLVNCGTSLYGGFAIFSVLGFMASELGVAVDEVTRDGPGLVFVAYPEALARMPVAPLWSLCFFLMLFTLGLDSLFAMFETIMSALADEFPHTVRPHKSKAALAMCIAFFLLGLPQCTQGGFYLLHLMDQNAATYPLLIIALLEIVAVMYCYGFSRYFGNIKTMLGHKPNIYWMVTWIFVTPVAILLIIIFLCITYSRITLWDYLYPLWGELLGWAMAAASLICIPAWMIFTFLQYSRNEGFKNAVTNPLTTLNNITRPTKDWGPALPEHRLLEQATLDTPASGVAAASYNVEREPAKFDRTQEQYPDSKADGQHLYSDVGIYENTYI